MGAPKEATAEPAAEAPRYRVSGKYVTVKTAGLAGMTPSRSGYAVVGLYRGALLPVDVTAADVTRLLARGLIEEVA